MLKVRRAWEKLKRDVVIRIALITLQSNCEEKQKINANEGNLRKTLSCNAILNKENISKFWLYSLNTLRMKMNVFQSRLIKPIGAAFTETLFRNVKKMNFEKCVKTACYVENTPKTLVWLLEALGSYLKYQT